jgi:hypothetical protein
VVSVNFVVLSVFNRRSYFLSSVQGLVDPVRGYLRDCPLTLCGRFGWFSDCSEVSSVSPAVKLWWMNNGFLAACFIQTFLDGMV